MKRNWWTFNPLFIELWEVTFPKVRVREIFQSSFHWVTLIIADYDKNTANFQSSFHWVRERGLLRYRGGSFFQSSFHWGAEITGCRGVDVVFTFQSSFHWEYFYSIIANLYEYRLSILFSLSELTGRAISKGVKVLSILFSLRSDSLKLWLDLPKLLLSILFSLSSSLTTEQVKPTPLFQSSFHWALNFSSNNYRYSIPKSFNPLFIELVHPIPSQRIHTLLLSILFSLSMSKNAWSFQSMGWLSILFSLSWENQNINQ